MTVGERIRQLRDKTGINRTDLSRLSGVALSYLNEIERDKKSPTEITLRKICNAFGINLAEFYSMGDQDLTNLPPDIWELVSDIKNHGLLRLLQIMKKKGYSNDIISEWIISLDNALSTMREKYDLGKGRGEIILMDEEFLPEASIGIYSEEKKRDVAKKLKNILKDPNFKLPWETDKG